MTNVLIIGASRGIGLEFANQFSKKGVNLYLTCRKSNPQITSYSTNNNAKIIENIDISKDEVSELFKNNEILPKKIDICVFNAGVLTRDNLENWSSDDIQWQFNCNSIGPLRAVRGLADRFSEGSQFFILSSRMGSISDASGGMYGYRMSKTAVNMVGKALSNDLKEKGVQVGILHPGYVKTDMTAGNGNIEVDESVSGLMKIIEGFSMEKTGTFWHTNGEELPW